MTTTTIRTLERAFRFGSLTLPDPDPTASPEQVMGLYTPNYPALAAASVEGPEIEGTTATYTFVKAPVKTKG
jgi:PRTRC genetic system protein C